MLSLFKVLTKRNYIYLPEIVNSKYLNNYEPLKALHVWLPLRNLLELGAGLFNIIDDAFSLQVTNLIINLQGIEHRVSLFLSYHHDMLWNDIKRYNDCLTDNWRHCSSTQGLYSTVSNALPHQDVSHALVAGWEKQEVTIIWETELQKHFLPHMQL